MGCIVAIYKDEKEYCAHSGEEWKEDEEPLFGYFSLDLPWDELIDRIAERYDAIRRKVLNRE